MYERFTDRARKVMQLANQEAQRFNHEYIGTEHILLGLVKEGSGVAANVLKNLDVDLRKIRLEVEKIVQSGPDMVTMGKLPQTPRVRQILQYAMEEACSLDHRYVGTEHLLLGLLREQEGVAAQVLMNMGLKLEDVRGEIVRLLGMPAVPPGDSPRLANIKITPWAERAIEIAAEESRTLNQNILGTEQLLIGLLREREGVAAQVLVKQGVTLEGLQEGLRDLYASGVHREIPDLQVPSKGIWSRFLWWLWPRR